MTGAACRAGTACSSFLVVRFPPGAGHTPQIVVPVTVNGLHFQIAFETAAESEYVIPLDRLWFWGAGSPATRRVDTAPAGGAVITVVQREPDSGVLY